MQEIRVGGEFDMDCILRHAVGLSWKTRPSQSVLAAVRGHRWVCAMPEGNLKNPVFSPSRFSRFPHLGEKRFWRLRLHANGCTLLSGREAEDSIPAKGGEKRCLAMGVASQL